MGKGCCDPKAPKPKMLQVDGGSVGVFGLDEILEDVYQLSIKTDEELAQALLVRFTLKNYVPSSARAKYAAALVEEFKNRYR